MTHVELLDCRNRVHAQLVSRIGKLYQQEDGLSYVQKVLLSDVQRHIASLLEWWDYEVATYRFDHPRRGADSVPTPEIPFPWPVEVNPEKDPGAPGAPENGAQVLRYESGQWILYERKGVYKT